MGIFIFVCFTDTTWKWRSLVFYIFPKALLWVVEIVKSRCAVMLFWVLSQHTEVESKNSEEGIFSIWSFSLDFLTLVELVVNFIGEDSFREMFSNGTFGSGFKSR